MLHAGSIVAIANGDYHVDEFGNVFAGKSWVGRLSPGEDIGSFLKEKVREYCFWRGCGWVIRTRSYDLGIDFKGRIFKVYSSGGVEFVKLG